MANRIAQVDAYIAKSAEFARPILRKIRELFHKAHPELQEVMKWSFPHFEYKGLVGSMAAFKQHCSFGLWKASLLKDANKLFEAVGNTSMGGRKISSLAEMPSDKVIIEYIRKAIALNEEGIKAPAAKRKKKKELTVPHYFLAALKKNNQAFATFEAFSPSKQREYVEWVTEAKQEATRSKRLATAIEWLA